MACKYKDTQGYCELSNNLSGKCKDLRHACNSEIEDICDHSGERKNGICLECGEQV